jgi:hypothetical protein
VDLSLDSPDRPASPNVIQATVYREYNPIRREIMFVRPGAQTVLPRGREVLHPR